MTEHDKHLHDAAPVEALAHEHKIGHLDDGEPITDSDINYGTLWFISITGALLTIAIIYMLVGLYGRSLSHEQIIKRIGKTNEIHWQQFEELRSSQLAQLSEESGWTNPDKGLVSIPMSDAVKSTLIEEQQKQAAGLAAENAAPASSAEVTMPAETSAEGDQPAADASGENAGDVPAATDETAEKEGI